MEISKALTSYLPLLRPHHLVLCISLKDSGLVEIADEMPDNIDNVYQKAVAGEHLMEQQNTLTRLQQSGVFVANPSPENLSVTTVNRYLELKGRKLI